MTINREELLTSSNLDLLAKQVVEGFITGLHKSPYHGFSVEFAEHRQYNTGESVRNIDWKLYARTEKLFVKKYEEETNLRCQILLDVSPSMYYPDAKNNKIRFSVLAAASLIHLLRKQRDAVGLTLFSDHVIEQTDTRSSGSHLQYLMNTLGGLLESKESYPGTRIADTLHMIAEKIHRRSLIILFTDMFEEGDSDDLFAALQHLKFNKHEVILFHTTDKRTEMDFDFPNRPMSFQDVESGEKVKLYPSEVREYYLDHISKFYRELKFKCAQYRIDFVETDIQRPIDEVLLPFLVKRQKMRA